MRAVLVGLIGKDKVFYDLDAGRGQKDGILEKENGSTVKFNFLDFAANARNLKKIRSTTFHRFLWDAPRDVLNGAWYESFVAKTRPVKDEMLEKIETHSSLGESRKKIKQKSESIDNFVRTNMYGDGVTKSCCDGVVQLNKSNYKFLSAETRNIAWEAMKITSTIEDV